MVSELKRILIGRPLESTRMSHERLPRVTALAVFSSDALSSVAYATEAILGVLIVAGTGALGIAMPIAVGIGLLLLIVAFSYRQTIMAYPSGGGAYIVVRENMGEVPSLVAAAALLIDYVLTVAVSISAGVAAITSATSSFGFGWVLTHRVEIAFAVIAFITIANLRGLKESGTFFAVPAYAFVLGILTMLAVGIFHVVTGNVHPVTFEQPPHLLHEGSVQALGVWLVLRAFAAGCTALTGVEAISDGVPAFKKPESHNAAATLTWMVILLCTMFLGITYLARVYGAVPIDHGETVVSQVARAIFGTGPVYAFIQATTALILILAANTAYADFPRLSWLLARDRFLPRQFTMRGDRLVFSNGIIALGFFSALLVWLFHAEEQSMLPLYAIGVFVSFTLSQSGMVLRAFRTRMLSWRHSLVISGLGATMTAIVLVVIVITRFSAGGWIVVVLMPIVVVIFQSIHKHYMQVARQLSLQDAPRLVDVRRHTAIVLISGVHKGVLPAVQYAKSIAPDNVTAVFVDLDADNTAIIRQKWEKWGCDVPLVVLESPYRSLIGPIIKYIDEVDTQYSDDMLTVVLPEFVPAKWWQHLLHNQTGILLKAALMYRRGRIVTSVPYRLER